MGENMPPVTGKVYPPDSNKVQIGKGVILHLGDYLEVLRSIPERSVDAVVTDPPYDIGFMGKEWDKTGVAFDPKTWRFVLRVMKPGGYMLTMGGTRTYHRLACAVEDAGFEIRDCLMWLYGTGFPKGKGCLKPAWEPILLARKPGPKVLPLGIEGCRVGTDTIRTSGGKPGKRSFGSGVRDATGSHIWNGQEPAEHVGRYPANVVHDGSEEVLEAFSAFGEKGGGFGVRGSDQAGIAAAQGVNKYHRQGRKDLGRTVGLGDNGTAARFFYCAKASRAERWVMLHCNCQTHIIPAWEKRQDQSRSALTDTTSPRRDTCGADSADECDSSTSSCGSGHTDPCRPAGKSTTPTKTNKTTGSTTSGRSAPPNTNESIPDVSCGAASGGSPAASAGSSSRSERLTGIYPPKDGRSTAGVGPAMWPASWKKNVCESCGTNLTETSHPTVKPLALMEWLVKLICPEGETVLDPFLGSGTTALACLSTGRKVVGVEKNPDYFILAKKRIEDASGKMENSCPP